MADTETEPSSFGVLGMLQGWTRLGDTHADAIGDEGHGLLAHADALRKREDIEMGVMSSHGNSGLKQDYDHDHVLLGTDERIEDRSKSSPVERTLLANSIPFGEKKDISDSYGSQSMVEASSSQDIKPAMVVGQGHEHPYSLQSASRATPNPPLVLLGEDSRPSSPKDSY